MSADQNYEGPAVGRNFMLWVYVLGPPLLWFVQMQTEYSLVHWAAVTGHRAVLQIVPVVFLVAVIALGIAAGMGARKLRQNGSRGRFMAHLGVLTCGLFLLAIVAQWAAANTLQPSAE